MATFYLDFESGNDANDGLSFANRWKTFQNGATAARTAPGDTIRIKSSPDPTSLGITATWTNNSPTVTLASSLNVNITDCNTVWTAAPNVTATANTFTYRVGTASANLAVAGAFTTGLVAHFPLGGAQDYSGYQGVTFWIKSTLALTSGVLSIRLCSDTLGTVAVDTFLIPAIGVNAWVPVYVDKAASLGAAIQSIALYAESDPGTVTINLDHFSTVKAAGSDNLSLTSLIGKNTAGEYWWALRRINDTSLTLDNSPTAPSVTTPLGYVGATETVTTYKRQCSDVDGASGFGNLQESGTSGNLITYSGGWNRTDMSTQTGLTYVDPRGSGSIAFNPGSFSFLHLDKLFAVRSATAFNCLGADLSFGEIGVVACQTRAVDISTNAVRLSIETLSVIQGTNDVILLTDAIVVTNLFMYGVQNAGPRLAGRGIRAGTFRIKNISGLALSLAENSSNNITIDTLEVDKASAGLSQVSFIQDFRIKTCTISNVTGIAANLRGGRNFNIDSLTLTSNGSAVVFDTVINANSIVIGNLVTSGNTSVLSNALGAGFLGDIYIKKSSFAEASPLSFTGATYTSGRLVFQDYDGVAGDHRTYYGSISNGATIFANSATRHTTSGLSWKFNVLNATRVTSNFPVVFPVARVAVTANKATTARLWTRRAATTVTGTFRCRGGQLAGVSTDQVASSSAAIDTWEELLLNFTPTETGVLEFDFLMYGAASVDLFIHDFSITQAA